MSVGSTIGAPVHLQLHPGPIPEAPVNHTSHSRVEARLERMETRIEQLEKIVHKLAPEHDECASRFPKLNPHAETVMAYSGCDADVKKETPGTTNITCQNGDSCSSVAPHRLPSDVVHSGTPLTVALAPLSHSLAFSHSL